MLEYKELKEEYRIIKLSACMKGFNVGDIVTVSNFTSPGIYSHKIEKYGYLKGEYYKNVGYCDLDHLEPVKVTKKIGKR